jgi:hypothetical protein
LSIENTSINYEISEDKNVPILVDESVNNITIVEEPSSVEEPPVIKQPEPRVNILFPMVGLRKQRIPMF